MPLFGLDSHSVVCLVLSTILDTSLNLNLGTNDNDKVKKAWVLALRVHDTTFKITDLKNGEQLTLNIQSFTAGFLAGHEGARAMRQKTFLLDVLNSLAISEILLCEIMLPPCLSTCAEMYRNANWESVLGVNAGITVRANEKIQQTAS